MPTFAFIDTNVLLHYRFFRAVDWAGVVGVSEIVLVFAPVVLSELDEHKWSGARRERSRAKAVLQALDDLGLASEAVDIRPSVRSLAIPQEPEETTFTKHRLQPGTKDDRLLASLLEFSEARRGDRVLLVSADGGLRVKARARRIEVIAPPDELTEPDEPDETERQLAAANRELAALRHAAPLLRLTIAGMSFIEREIRLVKPIDPATRARLLGEWRERYPYVSGTPDSFVMPGGGRFSLKGLGLPGYVSAEDTTKYNAKVDEVFEEYERYLTDWPSTVNQYRRSLELKFTVENTGTAPADDVHVRVRTEADGVWLENLPAPPKPPAMPKPRSPLDLVIASHLPPIDYTPVRAKDRDSEGPNVSEGDPRCVEYWERRVTHNLPRELSPVQFQFSTNEAVGSFGINYQLIAANVREPQTGTVHVKLSLAEPDAPPLPVGHINE